MNIKRFLKEIIISIFIIFSVVIWYAALSTVNSWDTLTSTIFNNLVNQSNTNKTDIANINSTYATQTYVDTQVAAAWSSTVIELTCSWRQDVREWSVLQWAITNSSCTPPICPTWWTDLNVIANRVTSVACSGNTNGCYFNTTSNAYHPVTVGVSVRFCEK